MYTSYRVKNSALYIHLVMNNQQTVLYPTAASLELLNGADQVAVLCELHCRDTPYSAKCKQGCSTQGRIAEDDREVLRGSLFSLRI